MLFHIGQLTKKNKEGEIISSKDHLIVTNKTTEEKIKIFLSPDKRIPAGALSGYMRKKGIESIFED